MARILCLDVGERRIGLAISTPEGRLAVPLRILERPSDDEAIGAIAELALHEGVQTIVAGHPIGMDGSIGPQAQRVAAFARRAAEAAGLPLELWDERLSSAQAERARRSVGRGRRRGAPSDDLAAAIILQSYLDRHANA